jgi:Cdc6-like AAA superfamily ATPase
MYVPGQPGTGKTHTVRAVLQGLACAAWNVPVPAMALINCMDRQQSSLGKLILSGLHDAAASLMSSRFKKGVCSHVKWHPSLPIRYLYLQQTESFQQDMPCILLLLL